MTDSVPTVGGARGRLGLAVRRDPSGDHTAERAALKEARIAAAIERELAKAPPLSPDQLNRLAVLLRPSAAS